MKTNDRIRGRIEKAVLYIEDNLSINLRASDIAKHAHLSPFHFQRLFSAYLGEPVSQYILSRRLERAARLLSTSNAINILELALDSGFDTHSSFSKAFKKRFAVSPSAFRDAPASAIKGVDIGRPFLIGSPGSKQIEAVENVDLPQFEFQFRKSQGTFSGSFFQQSDQDVSSQFTQLLMLNKDRCH
jgi:AraC family transcriptional regulator